MVQDRGWNLIKEVNQKVVVEEEAEDDVDDDGSDAVPDSVAIGVTINEGNEKTNSRQFAFAIEI